MAELADEAAILSFHCFGPALEQIEIILVENADQERVGERRVVHRHQLGHNHRGAAHRPRLVVIDQALGRPHGGAIARNGRGMNDAVA